jgi:hypothetical protein
MTVGRAVGAAGLLIALAIGAWLFALQSKNEGPTSPAVTQAETQALVASAGANFSQVTEALQGQLAQAGTYAGAELPAGSGVTLASASATSYCLETTISGTVVHEVGPGGSAAPGPC